MKPPREWGQLRTPMPPGSPSKKDTFNIRKFQGPVPIAAQAPTRTRASAAKIYALVTYTTNTKCLQRYSITYTSVVSSLSMPVTDTLSLAAKHDPAIQLELPAFSTDKAAVEKMAKQACENLAQDCEQGRVKWKVLKVGSGIVGRVTAPSGDIVGGRFSYVMIVDGQNGWGNGKGKKFLWWDVVEVEAEED